MNDNIKKISGFVVFCLEAYKREKQLDGAFTAELFEKHGVTEYLAENYDLLHTLGEGALIEDIEAYLSKRI